MSQFLFDMPPEPRPPDQTPPLSHRHDPQTSRDAAEQFRRSGKRAYHWWIILEGMKQCNGGTHSEIAAVTPLDWLQVARRLSELARAGLIRRGEERICRVKGSRCTTWWIVAPQDGPEKAASMRSSRLESTNGAGGRG